VRSVRSWSQPIQHQPRAVALPGSGCAAITDREETVSAGGALIVPAGEEFSLVAADAPAEAVCVMAVGGKAIVDGEAFTPPWAE
jgi:hypothetical protein